MSIESGKNFLPYLRIIRILNIILSEKPLPEKIEEDSDTMTIGESREYHNVSEAIIDQIWPELEQQYLVEFINVAFAKQEVYKGTPYEEMVKQIPYDLIYLSEFCESHFVYDNLANPSSILFSIKNIYSYYFLTEEIGKNAIEEDAIEKIRKQLLLLAAKKETLTAQKSILRGFYIEVLCKEVEKENIEDLVMNMEGIIDKINYSAPIPIVAEFKKIRNNLIISDGSKAKGENKK